MSEHSALSGATTVAEPPGPLLPSGFEDGDGDSRRKLMIVGAVAGVVVLLIAAFFLLKGGGSSSPAASGVVPHGVAPSSASGGTGQGHKPITLPKAFHGNVGRDPFKPLYTQPVAATGGGTQTGKSTGTGTGTGGGGGAPAPAPSTGPTKPAKFAPVWIELVSVHGTKSASFVVGESNGKKTRNVAYNNVPVPKNSLRTTFGGVFALLSIQDGMATVQYGDAQPFDLAPGFANRHFVG